MNEMSPVIFWTEVVGAGMFAASAASASSQRRCDLMTAMVIAAFSAGAGLILRDLLFGARHSWIHNPSVLIFSCFVALAVWPTRPARISVHLAFWLDVIGQLAYSTVAVVKAVASGVPASSAIVAAGFVGCVGSLVRDLLLEIPPYLVNRRYLLLPPFLAAFVGWLLLNRGTTIAIMVGMVAGLALHLHLLRKQRTT